MTRIPSLSLSQSVPPTSGKRTSQEKLRPRLSPQPGPRPRLRPKVDMTKVESPAPSPPERTVGGIIAAGRTHRHQFAADRHFQAEGIGQAATGLPLPPIGRRKEGAGLDATERMAGEGKSGVRWRREGEAQSARAENPANRSGVEKSAARTRGFEDDRNQGGERPGENKIIRGVVAAAISPTSPRSGEPPKTPSKDTFCRD